MDTINSPPPVLIHDLRKGSGRAAKRAKLHETLQNIVMKEEPHQPYDDVAIIYLLRKAGFQCSKTSVVYHRKLCGIPGSAARRNLHG